jgi:hypothetical protein
MCVLEDDYLENFCKQVLNEDYFIRSAEITDHVGHIIAIAHRQGSVPLMTPEETSRAAIQAAIRAATRDKFRPKIGELQFSISRYVRLIQATIPIKYDSKNKFLLLLTFDIDAEADSIILKKILPYIEKNRDYFL